MKQQIDFIKQIHTSTKRNYMLRVTEADKAECAEIARRFDKDYFDGDRRFGYGGYKYDGRWRSVALEMIKHYGLKPGDKVLDIGCGKGFLVYEFTQAMPGLEVVGIDISDYAIENSMLEIKDRLQVGSAVSLPFNDNIFDLVVSFNTLHNFRIYDLERALCEIERVGRKDKYIVNDAYRTEREKVNLFYWQLTCECFFTPQEWKWVFDKCGYVGDYSFIFFE